MDVPKIFSVRVFETEGSNWKSTKHLKKLKEYSVVACTQCQARMIILARYLDEKRAVYFLFYGLRDEFTAVVGKPVA